MNYISLFILFSCFYWYAFADDNCNGQFLTYMHCGPDLTCERTCRNPNPPPCDRAKCVAGCFCEGKDFLKNDQGNCVTQNQCSVATTTASKAPTTTSSHISPSTKLSASPSSSSSTAKISTTQSGTAKLRTTSKIIPTTASSSTTTPTISSSGVKSTTPAAGPTLASTSASAESPTVNSTLTTKSTQPTTLPNPTPTNAATSVRSTASSNSSPKTESAVITSPSPANASKVIATESTTKPTTTASPKSNNGSTPQLTSLLTESQTSTFLPELTSGSITTVSTNPTSEEGEQATDTKQPCDTDTSNAPQKDPCDPNPCQNGEDCVPEPKICIRAPCPQYACVPCQTQTEETPGDSTSLTTNLPNEENDECDCDCDCCEEDESNENLQIDNLGTDGTISYETESQPALDDSNSNDGNNFENNISIKDLDQINDNQQQSTTETTTTEILKDGQQSEEPCLNF